mmetsp:Transcript_107316/g.301974  ORF Transcript_107316/g.301974 Transcript_107316/m.301974 type:complete len:333 (-) Transcript_107316:307-1305(-)
MVSKIPASRKLRRGCQAPVVELGQPSCLRDYPARSAARGRRQTHPQVDRGPVVELAQLWRRPDCPKRDVAQAEHRRWQWNRKLVRKLSRVMEPHRSRQGGRGLAQVPCHVTKPWHRQLNGRVFVRELSRGTKTPDHQRGGRGLAQELQALRNRQVCRGLVRETPSAELVFAFLAPASRLVAIQTRCPRGQHRYRCPLGATPRPIVATSSASANRGRSSPTNANLASCRLCPCRATCLRRNPRNRAAAASKNPRSLPGPCRTRTRDALSKRDGPHRNTTWSTGPRLALLAIARPRWPHHRLASRHRRSQANEVVQLPGTPLQRPRASRNRGRN